MPATLVTFLGLGRMGLPMSANLVRAGFDVTGVDPRPSARRPAESAGVRWQPAARDSLATSDVVVSMLPSSAVTLEAAVNGLPQMRPGTTWIDMASNGPGLAAAMSPPAADAGVSLLEAPVGGGPAAAEQGELVLYVGGEAAALTQALPLLSAMADPARIHHVGAQGHGYLAKLVVNLLWFGQAVAMAEALLLAARADLDLGRLHDALKDSAVGGRFVDHDVTALLSGDYLTTFGLDACVEELDIVERLAASLDSPFELSSVVARTYRAALADFGPVDGELLAAAFLEQRARTELRRPVAGDARPSKFEDR